MGATERRSRQREELRAQILEAARRIVLAEGYAALTMRRIAEAVEYSPAAIYQYFANRDAIAGALMAQGFDQLAEAFEHCAAIVDPRERLLETGRAYVQFGLDHSETYRLMFMDDPQITADFLGGQTKADDSGARAYAALLSPVTDLHERGRLRAGLDVVPVADTLWSALHGLVALKLTCPKFPATPVDTLLPTMLASLLDGCLS